MIGRRSRHRRVPTADLSVWAVLAAVVLVAQSAAVTVERRGDELHLVAPHFHFLEGAPLDQLHDGATVTYLFSVSLGTEHGGGRFYHREERFAVSYDLWEEKFSVVREGRTRQSVSHLSAAAAEAWCLDAIAVPVASVPADKAFGVKLECSVAHDDEPSAGGGLTLSTLIDIFSRKGVAAPPHWELSSPPLRLSDLKDRRR